MLLIISIISILAAAVLAYFFYGIFAVHIGEMLRIKKETGISILEQLKIVYSQLKAKIKK
jgi:uncharacterized membrane protein required for colicin V production